MRLLVFRSLWLLPLVVSWCQSADMAVSSAGAPYAPLEVSKQNGSTMGPLSEGDREDLLKEFKGLVAMGLRADSYERWGGRSMADCMPPDSRSERWRYRCEVITAQCNGFYYFYPTESREASTLQHVEVKINAIAPELVNDLKTPLRSLFGRENVLAANSTRLPARGPVRRWKTEHDVADLFVDISENPVGLVRFVWKRGPLAASEQALFSSHPIVRAD